MYHTDTLVCGLQGTFIYNLTLALADQANPLSYLVETLLPSESPESEVSSFFSQFLSLVLANSKRTFIGNSGDSNNQVFPSLDDIPIIGSAFEKISGQRYLVRSGQSEGLANLNDLNLALG